MKKCSMCFEAKSLDAFSKDKARKDGYSYNCKTCMSDKFRSWQQGKPKEENNQRAALWKNKRISETRASLVDFLGSNPCVDCGNSDIRVLEFDHVGADKVAGIGKLIHAGKPWVEVLVEIAKCEVRCANCHRVKTGERGGHWFMAL